MKFRGQSRKTSKVGQGAFIDSAAFAGPFFCVKNSLYGVCVCVCPPRLLGLLITVMLKPYNKSLTQACSDDLKVTLSLSASRFAFSILTSCLGRGPPEVPSEAERRSPAGQPSYLWCCRAVAQPSSVHQQAANHHPSGLLGDKNDWLHLMICTSARLNQQQTGF